MPRGVYKRKKAQSDRYENAVPVIVRSESRDVLVESLRATLAERDNEVAKLKRRLHMVRELCDV